MSNFWDNNKEGIYSGAKSAGKYSFRGAKFVGKAGYNAAKNQRAKNVSKQKGESSSDSPTFTEARPLTSLQNPDGFAPPPLKPGQNQYTSKSRTPPTQATTAQVVTTQSTAQYDPNGQVQQNQYAQVYQQPTQVPGQPVYQQQQPGQVQYQQETAYVTNPPQSQQLPQQYLPQQATPQATPQQQQQPQQQQRAVPPAPAVPSRTSTSGASNSGNINIPASQIQVSGQNISLPAYSIDKNQAMSFAGKFMSGIAATQQPQQQQQQQQQQQTPQYGQSVTDQNSQQVYQQQVYQQQVPQQQILQQQVPQQQQQQYQQPAQDPQTQVQNYPQQIPQQIPQQSPDQPLQQEAPVQLSFQEQLNQQLAQQGQPVQQQPQQVVAQETTTVTNAAPPLDLQNPYYQGAVANNAASEVESIASESSTSTASEQAPAPPALGPRTYNRAPVLPPKPNVVSQEPIQQVAPVPISYNPNIQGTNTAADATFAANDPKSEPTPEERKATSMASIQSPDLSNLPLPPRHKDVSPSSNSPQLTGGSAKSGQSSSLKVDTTKKTEKENGEEEVVKGIAGAYEYKVDVKFAPPPRPHVSTPSANKRPPAKTTSSVSSRPVLPSRNSPAASRPSLNSSPAPPPRSGSSARPPPPVRPSSQASHADTEHPSHPPPPYSQEASTVEEPEQPAEPSRPSITSRLESVNHQFAPPPKAFRKPDEKAQHEPKRASSVASTSSGAPPPPRPYAAPHASQYTAPSTAPSAPASGAPSAVNVPVQSIPEPKKQPPPLKPKPSSFNKSEESRNTKKAPPPVAPKPSTLKKTGPPPPAKKPDIQIPGSKPSKPSPPVPKKKPSFQAQGAVNDFSKVVSELPQKNEDDADKAKITKGISKIDIGATKEDEGDEDDNPFKRYLRNAVPKEDDRFHTNR